MDFTCMSIHLTFYTISLILNYPVHYALLFSLSASTWYAYVILFCVIVLFKDAGVLGFFMSGFWNKHHRVRWYSICLIPHSHNTQLCVTDVSVWEDHMSLLKSEVVLVVTWNCIRSTWYCKEVVFVTEWL